jgi:hypothetical protein
LSSEPIWHSSDTVQEIFGVALSVLIDYGPEGETRVERMARWIAWNLEVDLEEQERGNATSIVLNDPALIVMRYGDNIALRGSHGFVRTMSKDEARQLATALLVCAERADML